MKRELAAAVAIPLVLAILFLLPPVAFDVLVVAIALAAGWEFFRMAEKTGLPVAKTVGLASAGLLLVAFAAALAFPGRPRPDGALVAAVSVALVLLAAVAPLFGGVDVRSALGGASATVFGSSRRGPCSCCS